MAPTGATRPSWTRILESTPAPGEGISTSTLSVVMATSGSSLATRWPTFLSQVTTVPSATLSPICGIMISMFMVYRGNRSTAEQCAVAYCRDPTRTLPSLPSISEVGELSGLRGDLVGVGQIRLFQHRAEWEGRVRSCHAEDRGIQVAECLLGQPGRDIAPYPTRLRRLVNHHRAPGFLHRGEDRRHIERLKRAEVHHLEIDPLWHQLFRGPERLLDHRAIGDDAHAAPWALHLCLADWDQIIPIRHFTFYMAVEVLVLKVDDWIRIAYRGLQESFGIAGGGGGHQLQTRHVKEPGLWRLRVIRPGVNAAAVRRPDDQRDGFAEAVVLLGRHIDDLVEGAGNEIGELHLHHRPHPH